MNPDEGCSKGHGRCVKACYRPDTCPACPYRKECCHRYCIILPPKSPGLIGKKLGEMNLNILATCFDFILKGESALNRPAYELLVSLGLIKTKQEVADGKSK